MISLKEIRTARGISQERLAELVGVSRQTISKWENGSVQPSADNLVLLSEVFHLPVEAFLKDDWIPPEQQAVETVSILPEVPPEPDAEPAAVPEEQPQEPDAEPAAPPAESPPRRRNYRLWAALAAIIAVIGIIAGMISFKQRGNDVTPEEKTEWEEADKSIVIMPGTRQPLQP